MFPFNVEMDSIKFVFLGILNDNNTVRAQRRSWD